jgi:hypothetical protein
LLTTWVMGYSLVPAPPARIMPLNVITHTSYWGKLEYRNRRMLES